MSSQGSYSEQELDQLVNNYISKKSHEATQAGQSPEEIQRGMDMGSFILTIKLLRNYAGDPLPTGVELIQDLATAMSAAPNEVRELCAGFVSGGWMNADFSLSETGKTLSGMDIPGL